MIFQIYGRNTFTTTEFCQPTHQPTLADLTCKWVSKCQLRAFYMRPGIPTLKGLIISRWLDLAPWHQALRHATNFSAPNMCTQWWHSAMATQKCLVAGSKNFPLHIFTWLKTFSWLFCHLGWIPALCFGREFGIRTGSGSPYQPTSVFFCFRWYVGKVMSWTNTWENVISGCGSEKKIATKNPGKLYNMEPEYGGLECDVLL